MESGIVVSANRNDGGVQRHDGYEDRSCPRTDPSTLPLSFPSIGSWHTAGYSISRRARVRMSSHMACNRQSGRSKPMGQCSGLDASIMGNSLGPSSTPKRPTADASPDNFRLPRETKKALEEKGKRTEGHAVRGYPGCLVLTTTCRDVGPPLGHPSWHLSAARSFPAPVAWQPPTGWLSPWGKVQRPTRQVVCPSIIRIGIAPNGPEAVSVAAGTLSPPARLTNMLPKHVFFLPLLLKAGAVLAERPSDQTICDYHAAQRFGENNKTTQLRLMQGIVAYAYAGGGTLPEAEGNNSTGIFNPGRFDGRDVFLRPYFNGSSMMTACILNSATLPD